MTSLKKLMIVAGIALGAQHANAAIDLPELMYFKFDEGSGTTTANEASSPVGTVNAPVLGVTLGGIGAFGSSALNGSSDSPKYVNTGWAPTLNSGSWTLSFWTGSAASTSSLSYFFGDSSSFRGFTEGVAGADGFILRGTGVTDTLITGLSSSTNNHIAFVYDAGLDNIKGYLNGALDVTVSQPGSFTFGTDFSVGGRGPSSGASALQPGVWMDEFQLYSRALDASGVIDAMNANFNSTSAVPEPSTLALFGLGLLGLAVNQRKRKVQA